MEHIANFIGNLKKVDGELQEVLIYNKHRSVELSIEERVLNTDAINFMHALTEFGRHVGTFIYRYYNGTSEAKKVKKGLIGVTDPVGYGFIRAFYSHISLEDWTSKVWLSEGLDTKEGIYAMVLVMTKCSAFAYKSTSLEAMIVRELMEEVINVYFQMVRMFSINVPPKALNVDLPDYSGASNKRPDFKAILARDTEPSTMYMALSRAANSCHI